MTVTVHIWEPRGSQVGHAAVQVDGPHGKAYISWWPSEEGKNSTGKVKDGRTMSVFLGVPGVRFDYAQDKEGEGNVDSLPIKLEGLDEAGVIKWWKAFALKNWSLLNTNCAQVAADALRAGGAGAYVQGMDGWLSSWQATYWKPLEVLRFARAVEAGLASRRR